ncbi:MAG: (2Fe-2S)-binding protein [Desulfobacteraceae bacterium]|nr:(2Fe-2S)-binding protein [Desulfobacteraceae bacterium]
MKKIEIQMTVNGDIFELAVSPTDRLIDTLRQDLGLTGTKEGCGEGECGACTINIDGKAVLACLMLTVQADGATILTIEGLQKGRKLHVLQESFISESAVQCGYCTPGMIMASHALLKQHPQPDEDLVRQGLANNLCRCTGYERPVKAVLAAVDNYKERADD